MENLGLSMIDQNFWKGKRVFLTGHTGFKGSWLSLWLSSLDVIVRGYSLNPPTAPSLFEEMNIADLIDSKIGDIRDLGKLKKSMLDFNPDILIHMAAQPLVRYSYESPVETYEVNVMGTVNVLEAARSCSNLKAIVNITTDKCYENEEWDRGYKEEDPMGGHDPYSSSKGCAELVTSAYRRSFLKAQDIGLASVRAGNVIGGGDWAKDRIVPDIVRSFSKDEILSIRAPNATRPWQHVLEPLSGYLTLAKMQTKKESINHESFNFGPRQDVNQNVLRLVEEFSKYWDSGSWRVHENNAKPEAGLLKLNCDKAQAMLDWKAILSFEETIKFTGEWYKTYFEEEVDLYDFTIRQINEYSQKAKKQGLKWTE